MIRKARMDDVRQIHKLLQELAEQKLLLGRSINSLYDYLRDFVVWPEDDKTISAGMTWLRSVHWRCWKTARVEVSAPDSWMPVSPRRWTGIAMGFTLIYQPGFFRRLGFEDIDKRELPHKF